MESLRAAFSFHGRRSRSEYWTTFFLVWIATAVGVLLVMLPVVGPFIGVPVFLACAVAGLANTVRRLHDRGRSGYWLLLVYAVAFVGQAFDLAASHGPDPDVFPFGVLLTLPASLWLIVEVGFLRGTSGLNRFGEDPLGSVSPQQDAGEAEDPDDVA